MANTGGTPARTPAARGAQQRYYNKASGRMETTAQMHAYRPPAPVPAGHQVSKTTQTTTSVKPTFNPNNVADWTKLTGPQLRAFAENLVNKDIAAARTPFQQRLGQLGSEQQGSEQRYGQTAQNTQSILGGIKTGQEGTAKTLNNQAADIVAKSQQGVEGIYKGQQGYVPPQVQQEREREEALSKNTGAAFQQGVQARNEAQTNYLQGVQASAAQRGQERQGEIAKSFGKQREGVTQKEAQVVAEAPNKVQELWLKLTGQKTALDEARAKLGIQVQKNEITRENDVTKNRIGAANAETKRQQVKGTESYRHASLAEKERMDSANIKDKAERLRVAAEKNVPGSVNPATGKPFSGKEISTAAQGVGAAFQAFQRGRESKQEYNAIREGLEKGYKLESVPGKTHFYKGKAVAGGEEIKKLAGTKVQDPVLIRAALQLWKYHHMDPQVKQQLASKGLRFKTDQEAYEALTGQPYTPGQPYTQKPPRGGHVRTA